MFVSFFPQPKLFFSSAVVWSLLPSCSGSAPENIWAALSACLRLLPMRRQSSAYRCSGRRRFSGFTFTLLPWSAFFYAFWAWYSPHPWQNWSILGSALILFITYFQVQVSVAINNWYGPFWDLIQAIISGKR